MNYCGNAYTKWEDEHDKIIWPLTKIAPWWWLRLLTQNKTMNRKEKHYVHLPPPHHNDDQFYLHKMRPWIEGKKIMGICHSVIVAPQWWSILLIQMRPWTRGGKMMGTCHCMTIAPWRWWIMLNAYTKWEHEQKRKKYGHLLPSHHGHDWCYLTPMPTQN